MEAERAADFRRYLTAVQACDADVDVCLVDGRLRVACFLEAVKALRPDAVIGIHPIREFGHEITTAEDLTVSSRFSPRISTTRAEGAGVRPSRRPM